MRKAAALTTGNQARSDQRGGLTIIQIKYMCKKMKEKDLPPVMKLRGEISFFVVFFVPSRRVLASVGGGLGMNGIGETNGVRMNWAKSLKLQGNKLHVPSGGNNGKNFEKSQKKL